MASVGEYMVPVVVVVAEHILVVVVHRLAVGLLMAFHNVYLCS